MYRFWLGFVLSLPGTAFLIGMESELADPWVGPAIVAEAGRSYAVHVHVLLVAILGAHALGVFLAIRRRRRAR